MSFENLGLSLLALFLQLFVVVITIAVCKAKLLYLGINAALFFLISHTTPSYVPLTWLCFAVALLFVLESLSDTHSVWLDRWKRFSTCVLVLDLVVGNLYDDFFTEAFLFLIPYLALNAAAYLGLLIAAWPIPDPTDPPTDKRTKAWRAVCGGPTRLPQPAMTGETPLLSTDQKTKGQIKNGLQQTPRRGKSAVGRPVRTPGLRRAMPRKVIAPNRPRSVCRAGARLSCAPARRQKGAIAQR